MADAKRKTPIGVDDFKMLREGGYYYVDKSELISDIVSDGINGREVYLFTRPRRFGKTLNLSMIGCFFDIRSANNRWFDGLKVLEHPDSVARMNLYPVIRIDMKDLPSDDYRAFISKLAVRISELFKDYAYLLGSDRIQDEEKTMFRKARSQELNEAQLQDSVRILCGMLSDHHGIDPVVLIDEYDDPINNAYEKGSYDRILGFLKLFYSGILKGNRGLAFAVVTGVMQIANASIFSGTNNLHVNNIFSKDSDERYGFTAAEVQDICLYYGEPDGFAVAKEWYDGYRFGDAEIYNPWSVLNFASSRFEPRPYWAGTSGNSILDALLDHADDRTFRNLADLANDRSIVASIPETVVMSDLENDRNAVYSVMASAGYLNAVPQNGRFALSVPNKEMRGVFASVMERSIHSDAELAFGDLFDGMEHGDEKKVRSGMQRILDESIPFILLTKEKDYELIVGAAAMSRLGRYTVSLEKESGNGRADIVMIRNSPRYPDIILELKRTRSSRPEILDARAKEGLDQIKGRSYFRQMEGRVLLWGIAFHGKDFGIAFEEIDRRGPSRSHQIEEVPVHGRVGCQLGMERRGDLVPVADGHGDAVEARQDLGPAPDTGDGGGADELERDLAQAGEVGPGGEAPQLPAVGVPPDAYRHRGEMGIAALDFLREHYHPRAGAQHGGPFEDHAPQAVEHAEVAGQLPHDGALAAGNDEGVRVAVQVGCLADLEALRAEALEHLLVLDERTLDGQDAHAAHWPRSAILMLFSLSISSLLMPTMASPRSSETSASTLGSL